MGQILIRNIDDEVHARLKAKAAARGRSLEAYVRDLLSDSAKPSKTEVLARAAEIRKSFRGPPMTAEQHQARIEESKRALDERAGRLSDLARGTKD